MAVWIRVAAEVRVKELQATVRGLKAMAKSSLQPKEVVGSLKLQMDFASVNQQMLRRTIERDLAAYLPVGASPKVSAVLLAAVAGGCVIKYYSAVRVHIAAECAPFAVECAPFAFDSIQ